MPFIPGLESPGFSGMTYKYLIPINPMAFGIFAFLVTSFVVWLIVLIRQHAKFRKLLGDVNNCQNIELLKNALDKKLNDEIDNAEATRQFDQFLSQYHLEENNPISAHLKAIYLTGLRNSNLEVGELLKFTGKAVFKANVVLRAVLATFIIIGLLGTLFGLAENLPNLQITSDNLPTDFFSHLSNAFGPSILGVFLTIFGVLIYNVFLRMDFQPLIQKLEYFTLTIWVPNLIPTTAQKFDENIHQTFEAAKNIVDSSRDIETKTGALSTALEEAAVETSKLVRSSANINEFSKNFVQAVDKLGNFQKTIGKLYTDIVKDAEDSRKKSEESYNKIVQLLEKATDVLSSAIITERLRELSAANEQALASIGRSIAAEIRIITDRMHAWEIPIKEAAETIQASVTNYIARNTEFERELKEEFAQTENKRIEQDLKILEMNTRIEALYKKIDNSIEKLNNSYLSVSTELKYLFGSLKITLKETIESFGKTQSQTIIEYIKPLENIKEKLEDSISIFQEQLKSFGDKLQLINGGQDTLSLHLTTASNALSELNQTIKYIHFDISTLEEIRAILKEIPQIFSGEASSRKRLIEKPVSIIKKFINKF
jgi:biopolymer transport protein ExbB/TolQ